MNFYFEQALRSFGYHSDIWEQALIFLKAFEKIKISKDCKYFKRYRTSWEADFFSFTFFELSGVRYVWTEVYKKGDFVGLQLDELFATTANVILSNPENKSPYALLAYDLLEKGKLIFTR